MRNSVLLFLFLLTATATIVLAQGRGYGPGPRYNSAAEVTVAGTIEEIRTMDAMCHKGTHITLKTDKGNVEVALGPASFLSDQKLDLKKGDQAKVVGAKITTQNGEMFVARQITIGSKELAIRDSEGVPVWPRGMCRQQ